MAEKMKVFRGQIDLNDGRNGLEEAIDLWMQAGEHECRPISVIERKVDVVVTRNGASMMTITYFYKTK